jgi:hypothetical protein
MATTLELSQRVKGLEAKVEHLEQMVAVMRQILDSNTLASKPETRKMCPKCGEKPNYFFHVKNCTGPEKNKNNGPDRRRDHSTA